MPNQAELRMTDTAGKLNACALDSGEPKKNKHDETRQFAEFSFHLIIFTPGPFSSQRPALPGGCVKVYIQEVLIKYKRKNYFHI